MAKPHLSYGRGDKRGYVTVELTAARCTIGFEALDDEKQKDGATRRLATFVVEDGVTGAKRRDMLRHDQAAVRRGHRPARPPGGP